LSLDLRREFETREELIDYVRQQFPDTAEFEEFVPETQGGRHAAQALLDAIDPKRYGQTRNNLTGAVTQLSPYIRHGVVTLREVRDTALSKVEHNRDAAKFIMELAWREYWQRIYDHLGLGVWEDIEEPKTGHAPSEYEEELPANIKRGTTGLACMDGFSRELRRTGYLHNHARMWLASYVVHWRKVKWQAGAEWFLEHLLDGDPASNNLSWQWVASSFSNKPYFFNRENLERHTDGLYCRVCRHYGSCPFEGAYEDLSQKLFQIQ
jgi:deoxyribodipyrimidine photo-lyase